MLTAACSRRTEAWDCLEAADAVMESAPDSALTILSAIDSSALAPGEETARYALLLTQAQVKNYIPIPSDSLIAIACDYYTPRSDRFNKMRALYYHAQVLYDNGE